MNIAALLLLALFAVLCQTAVVTNPNQLRDSGKADVNRGTIIQRASGSTSSLSDGLPADGENMEQSFYLTIRPGKVSGPADRLYDWDESCTDSTQRQKISDAYNAAIRLIKDAQAKLKTLANGLPKRPTAEKQAENQNWIVGHDPAYTQMFFALDNRIEEVRELYERIILGMESSRSSPGSERRGAYLRFICDPDVKRSNGERFCNGVTEAETTNIAQRDTIEAKYAFETAASIVFCPPFFDDAKFPSTLALEQHLDQNCNLDRVQSRDRVMIHEWTHLAWNLDIEAGLENYGYLKAAKTAGKGSISATGKDRIPDWTAAKKNAENFAWYAIYHHWNELCPGTTAGNSCGDVWPQGGTSKNPRSLNFWKPPKPNPIQF